MVQDNHKDFKWLGHYSHWCRVILCHQYVVVEILRKMKQIGLEFLQKLGNMGGDNST